MGNLTYIIHQYSIAALCYFVFTSFFLNLNKDIIITVYFIVYSSLSSRNTILDLPLLISLCFQFFWDNSIKKINLSLVLELIFFMCSIFQNKYQQDILLFLLL